MLRVVDSASVSQDIWKGVPQPSRSGDIVRAVIVLSVIAFRVIMLRLFSRPLVAEILWGDWAIVAASVCNIRATDL